MPDYAPISKSVHAGKGWCMPENLNFTSSTAMVPVLTEELGSAIQVLPLAFLRRKTPENRYKFQLVALLSPVPKINLFLKPSGTWLLGHIPVAFRSYPFSLLVNPANGEKVIGFDQESGLMTDAGASGSQPFFNEEGQPSPDLLRYIEFLQQYDARLANTQKSVNALADAGLLMPWKITIKDDQQDRKPLQNLFKINGEALKDVDQETLYSLHQSNALTIAYTQLISELRFQRFGEQLSKYDDAVGEDQSQVSIDEIEALLGGNKDSLNFD